MAPRTLIESERLIDQLRQKLQVCMLKVALLEHSSEICEHCGKEIQTVAQVLTEIELLPGALTRNDKLRFECKDVCLKVSGVGPFTPRPGEVWRLPIAHAEGRYQASKDVMKVLEGEGRIGLVYSTADGEVTEDANPNGSQRSIAGIYGGPRRNVFGLMPHPERMSEPALGGTDGRKLFDAVLSCCASSETRPHA